MEGWDRSNMDIYLVTLPWGSSVGPNRDKQEQEVDFKEQEAVFKEQEAVFKEKEAVFKASVDHRDAALEARREM